MEWPGHDPHLDARGDEGYKAEERGFPDQLKTVIGLHAGGNLNACAGRIIHTEPYKGRRDLFGITPLATRAHRVVAFPRRNHGQTQWRSIRGERASGRAAC